MAIEGDKIYIGSRSGIILSIEDGWIYYVYMYQLVNGVLKAVDDTRLHKIKESSTMCNPEFLLIALSSGCLEIASYSMSISLNRLNISGVNSVPKV